MTDKALKPCPFCGCELTTQTGNHSTRVLHPNVDSCILANQSWWLRPEFVAMWETRA